MELIIEIFYYTPLHFAVKKNYIEIVKLLLSMPNIDVNVHTILKNVYFNSISNQLF